MKKNSIRGIEIVIIIVVLILLVLYAIIPNFECLDQSKSSEHISYKFTDISIGFVNVSDVPVVWNRTSGNIFSTNPFNISFTFTRNITLKYIYIADSQFRVNKFYYSYEKYSFNGSGQGNFIGSIITDYSYATVNITIFGNVKEFDGNLSIHLVGNVPPNIVY